jgi:hypothetical protein
MVTRGIRDYVGRDWAAVRASKDAYWAERLDRLGPVEALRVADELRRQMRALHPGWPDESSRESDLAVHARVAALFRRADSTRRR